LIVTASVNKKRRLGYSKVLTEAIELPARLRVPFPNASQKFFCSSEMLMETQLSPAIMQTTGNQIPATSPWVTSGEQVSGDDRNWLRAPVLADGGRKHHKS
jgi:hypothetical protein